MATSSLNSISGVSTGIDTTALINAIVAQKGAGVTRLKDKQTFNDLKTTTLTAMKAEMNSLISSLAVLQDKFNGRAVTSSDANNTNVTATGTGAAAGNYDVTVHTVATKGRISGPALAVASPSDSVTSGIFSGTTPASFAIQGTDGVIKQITLTVGTNTLNGLRDAINASGAGVTASIVNVGTGAKPYQLVISAKDTGTGTTGGIVTIADITNMQPNGTAGVKANNLGILAGGTSDAFTKNLSGLTSASSGANATDATFSLNGIELTRTTNTVKDAADGMVLTLKQGGQTGTTTLTVAADKAGVTSAMQDFLTKYNTLLKDYKTASTSTKKTDGSVAQAPLAGDATTFALMAKLKAVLGGASAGLPASAAYKNLTSLGISRGADGSLSLNTINFQKALDNDQTAVAALFSFTGTSTNSAVAFQAAGPDTATGTVDFAITKDAGGVLWGSLTQNGVPTGPIQVINGILSGTGVFAGLKLSVVGTGTGTLTLSRGIGLAASDLLTSYNSINGAIAATLSSIVVQNKSLLLQIQRGQAMLDNETAALKKRFAQMEAVVGRMRASAGSLSGA